MSAATSGCSARPIVFACVRDAQCPTGWCEPEGHCSFPDPACESERRYSRYSPPELSEQCTTPSAPGEAPQYPPSPPATTTEATETGGEPEPAGTTGGSTTEDDEAQTGTTSDGDEPAPCNVLYGDVDGFELCAQSDTACEFFARTHGSCNEVCNAVGVDCVTAFNDLDEGCERANETDCDSRQSTQICRCERQSE